MNKSQAKYCNTSDSLQGTFNQIPWILREFHEQIEDRPGKRGSLNPQKISVTEIFVARHGKNNLRDGDFLCGTAKILRDGDFLVIPNGDFLAGPDKTNLRHGDFCRAG